MDESIDLISTNSSGLCAVIGSWKSNADNKITSTSFKIPKIPLLL